MLDKLKEIICEYVAVEPENVTEEATLRGELGMKSLDIVSVVSACENEFGVSVPNSAFGSMRTVSDLMDCIKNA